MSALIGASTNSIWWLSSVLLQCPRMALSASISAGIVLYYILEVVKRPIFACRPKSRWNAFLRHHLSILEEKYWPPLWCFESRAQTILASVMRTTLPDILYKREILKLKDGGEICLDWLDSPHSKGSDVTCNGPHSNADDVTNAPLPPIVIILPGLTGHSQSEYVKSFVLAAQEQGATCVVFNNRGRGGHPLKTSRTYCAANSDDFEESLMHIRSKFPHVKIIASGISLGGMILGNYLATRGEKAVKYLEAAMVLSIAWNVFIGTESLEKPICNLLLNRHLANCLCESVRCMKDTFDGNQPWDLDLVMKSKTIREFDSRFTAVQFGFRDVEDYYQTASLHDKLDRIRVPLVCLSAADDPFQPLEGIPIESANNSSHVAIIVTSRGGHIGFMEGLFPSNTYYSDRLFKQLLNGIFTNPQEMEQVKIECTEHLEELTINDT